MRMFSFLQQQKLTLSLIKYYRQKTKTVFLHSSFLFTKSEWLYVYHYWMHRLSNWILSLFYNKYFMATNKYIIRHNIYQRSNFRYWYFKRMTCISKVMQLIIVPLCFAWDSHKRHILSLHIDCTWYIIANTLTKATHSHWHCSKTGGNKTGG